MSILSTAAKQAFLTGDLAWGGAGADEFAAALVNAELSTIFTNPSDPTERDLTPFAESSDVTALPGWLNSVVATEVLDTDTGVVEPGVNNSPTGTAIVTGGSTTFENVQGGLGQVWAIVIYRTSDNLPIAFIDEGMNLPVLPNGGDITVYWNNTDGQGEVFSL